MQIWSFSILNLSFRWSKITIRTKILTNRLYLSPSPPSLLIYPHHRHFSRANIAILEGNWAFVTWVSFLAVPIEESRGLMHAADVSERATNQSKYQRPRALMTVLSLLETSTRTTNLLLAISTRHFTA